ncbi:glycosyltransferase [Agromyces seonyuensis]|uniref:Glycosyltransferase n=1 Tax=Agromyces seonyuensis TaxID=2662446 RepID=A0A6I4NZR3_9MICO|nr:glycosyltransferase [Agromyces seonyuensis]MWB97259.1 glycosyltransferase [Agromyces seonyuensis]
MSGLIVHEWLEPRGGAERVLHGLADAFPDAPVLCAWDDVDDRFAPGRLHQTWLAKTPLRRRKALAMPFMLGAWRGIDVHPDADWLLVSSHLFAHHATLADRDVPKFVYAHTPARYIWEPDLDGRGSGVVGRAVSPSLRRIDRARAQEATSIAANSRFVAERIARAWGRESTVIHPPVDVAAIAGARETLSLRDEATLAALPDSFVLGASRFVPYKRLDLVIEAGRAAGLPVVLAGDGPDRPRLEAVAATHPGAVFFVDRPSDALLHELYRRALVYVFAPIEDFGIMPVEALAAGTPVITNPVGGAAETVQDGLTGAHLRGEDAGELRRAIEVAATADPAACRARAWEFDGSGFGAKIASWMGVAASPVAAATEVTGAAVHLPAERTEPAIADDPSAAA